MVAGDLETQSTRTWVKKGDRLGAATDFEEME
jgi:hypothetical protein